MERDMLLQELKGLGLYDVNSPFTQVESEFEFETTKMGFTLSRIFGDIDNIKGANNLICNGKPVDINEILQQSLKKIYLYPWKANTKYPIFHKDNAIQSKRENLDDIRFVVIHETDGFCDDVSKKRWGEYYPSWNKDNNSSGTHFVILTDGTIIQMYDINSILIHASSRSINKSSIGIEIANKVFSQMNSKKREYPLSEKAEVIDKSYRNLIRSPFNDVKNEKQKTYSKFYLVPPIEQLESLYLLMNILSRLLKNISDLDKDENWIAYQEQKKLFNAGVVPKISGNKKFLAHSNIIPEKFDGWFPSLYCFLRFTQNLDPNDAYIRAKNITENATAGVINIMPTAIKIEKPNSKFLNVDSLIKAMPGLSKERAELFTPLLIKAINEFHINTPDRRNMFLAQVGHESGNFKFLKEIGKDEYFNRYEGRKDLGNTQPGDGLKFKGRGAIQITGRSNYEKVGKALGLDLINHPELLEKPENAIRASAWWWENHGLNQLVDKNPNDVKPITRVINGGYNGLEDRQKRFERIKSIFGD